MRNFYFVFAFIFFSQFWLFAQTFTSEELAEIHAAEALQSNQNLPNEPDVNYSVNAEFIPEAGANEVFEPIVGDWFYDTGGPGGSVYPDYDNPGDYESCSCMTTIQLVGVSEIKFHDLGIFTTWDYLRIYDGTDNTGTLLFFNGSGGMNEGVMTLDELIVSHGSDTFTASSGNFYFEFYATSVVAYNGWEIEIMEASGEGGGCVTPSLSIEEFEPICEGNTLDITAVSDGEEINWYDNEDAITPIFSGSVFTTPELTETTTYWAKAFNYAIEEGEEIEGGARLAPDSYSSSEVLDASDPWGLSFDVTESFVINSVEVYLASDIPGDLVMQLLDENWNLIEETTISCPAGNSTIPEVFEVPLDFSVEAGNTYRLVASSSPEMVREFSSDHPGFPYPIGDVGSVTGGTINNTNTNSGVYYFFYNWTVTTGEISTCESDLVEIEILVNPTPDSPIAIGDFNFEQGEMLADLEDSLDYEGDLTWYADEEMTEILPDDTLLVDGTTYWVTQTINGCESEALAVLVEELGVNDINIEIFSVYPNPVKEHLFITGSSTLSYAELFDLNGRKLMKFTEVINNSLDLSSVEKGIYLLKLYDENKSQIIKIIKE